ncbi:retinitis pigmentosa 1-like 1 protein, partial [Embiotoca jacksoni]|uniref:retinitis pigmentosa 1-like 1 protein n=1 Tax=Embiotoca jacksoni TaxID=100190 RepID=UPI003703FB52
SGVSGSHADVLCNTFLKAAQERHDKPLSLFAQAALPTSSVLHLEYRQNHLLKMSSHKRSFQCFNTIWEGSHKSSLPFKHHSTRLPRLPQHGIVAHQPVDDCYLCSEYRHAQALEAVETHLSPFYHTHTPYHHHHPPQYVIREPSMPEEAPLVHARHIHHHRYNKKVVLLKNSDPSFKRTIVLHRRSLRSFGLFLEEVSELMQYHIRKLYTLEGRKIDSVQSLLQCPTVLVCVGREPSHPLIVENFRKTSNDKLPKLSGKSRSTDGHESRRNVNQGLTAKKSVVHPSVESDNRAARQLVSSDKSVPDGTDSPDNVDSCLQTDDGIREDDIEKRVCINEDGSLSMEMKVRFRLQNKETLHWSTEVKKKTNRSSEYLQGHSNPHFTQVKDKIYSESENISAGEQDEAYSTQHYQRHTAEPHCPHCGSHFQDYDIWKNVPETHGASRRIQTSSSSASSRKVVSRKTVADQKTMSRSSEDLIEQVVERQTCVKETVETAETVEYCIIRSETCSPRCNVQPATLDNSVAAYMYSGPNDQINVETAQTTEQEEQAGPVTFASSQVLKDDEENQNVEGDDVPPSASRASSRNSAQDDTEGQSKTQAEEEGEEHHEENEERAPSPTTIKSGRSRNSNASARSKKSKASEVSAGKGMPNTPKKSKVANEDMESKEELKVSTVVDGSPEERTSVSSDKSIFVSKTNKSTKQDPEETLVEDVYKPKSVEKSATSETSQSTQQPKGDKNEVMYHTESSESDLSQTLSSSDLVKEICENQVAEESKSNVSKPMTNDELEATHAEGSVTDSKNYKSSKHGQRNTDAEDFKLVPSSLPNVSPTEVVNEWLKTIQAEGDTYDIEELNGNCDGQKTELMTEEIARVEDNENNDGAAAENPKDTNEGDVINSGPDNDRQKSPEAPNEDNNSAQKDDAAKVFNSSIQVMKVLLNPKLDRCNSLPEISPVYGRKLSTAAGGLLDCLVKLQLIDHNPKNANEKDKRYQELMNVLQSLWLYDPPENERVVNKDDHHSLDDEYNHTSSSGVDVNSGSTGSGKSSDGVKSSNDVSADASQAPTGDMFNKVQKICEGETEADTQWRSERVEEIYEEKQKEDNTPKDETIGGKESPTELRETLPSSSKSYGNDSNGQTLSDEVETNCPEDSSLLIQKARKHPDPVWVLTLLTKIEKQFMKHYTNAMKEFKIRWNLGDNEQLDVMIHELKTEVHKRIQASVDRELRKIQARAGMPRPPKEAMSRTLTTQAEERRQRLLAMLQQSVEKSEDSATGTSFSDQRSENNDGHCPCETCNMNTTSGPPLVEEVARTAPVVMDFDLKRILVMKLCDSANTQDINYTSHSGNDCENKAAGILVEEVISGAVKEMEGDEVHQVTENVAFAPDEKEVDDVSQDAVQEDSSENDTIKELSVAEETVQVFSVDSKEEISKTEDDESENESADLGTVEEEFTLETVGTAEDKIIEAETAIAKNETPEDDTEDAIPASEECKYESKEETADKAEDIFEREIDESPTCENENAAEHTAVVTTTEHQSDKEDAAEEISATGSEESEDENDSTILEDNSAKELTEEVTTDDETAGEKKIAVSSKDELKMTSETVDDESTAVETSVAASEHEPEKDEAEEEGIVSDGEKIPAISADESADEITDTAKADESSDEPDDVATTEDEAAAEETALTASPEHVSDHEDEDEDEENDATGDKPAEEASEDELVAEREMAVTSEDEANEDPAEIATAEDDNAKETAMAVTSEQESDKDEAVEEGIVSEEGEVPAISADESSEENNGTAMADESSEEPVELATTEDKMTTDHESDNEEAGEAGKVDDEEETGAASESNSAEDLEATTNEDETVDDNDATGDEPAEEASEDELVVEKEMAVTSDEEFTEGASIATTAEDENAAAETPIDATSEHESEKDEAEEEGKVSDEEKIPAISANESEDENNETATADESEDQDEAAAIEDEKEKEIALTGESESKDETAEDETAAEGTDNEDAAEAEKVDDGEETGAASESNSAEDLEATKNEEEIAGENDATGDEPAEEASEDELMVEREMAVTSDEEFTEGASIATTAEDENVAAETPIDATSEHESEKDEAEEEGKVSDEEKIPAISANESEDENNDTAIADESEDQDEAAAIEDEKEIALTGESESKDETAEDETAAEGTDNEDAAEAEKVDDGEETGAASEDDSAGDLEATKNEEEITGENDATGDEPAEEASEDELMVEREMAVTSDEEANEENTMAAPSEHESDNDEAVEAGMVGNEDQTSTKSEDENTVEKDVAVASEDEAEDNNAAEEPDVVATTENKSDKEASVEGTSADESDDKEAAENVTDDETAEKQIAVTSVDEMEEEEGEVTK